MSDLKFRYFLRKWSLDNVSGKILIYWARTANLSLGTIEDLCEKVKGKIYLSKNEKELIRIILDRIVDYYKGYLVIHRLILYRCEKLLLFLSPDRKIVYSIDILPSTRKQVEEFFNPDTKWEDALLDNIHKDMEIINQKLLRRKSTAF